MLVSFSGNQFICKSSFAERGIPRQAGFCFDPDRKVWYTTKPEAAARLQEYLDESAKKQINRILLSYQKWAGPVPYPAHLVPYPFQIEAAKFSLARNRSYLGLDAGLGKTIVAALIMNALPDANFTYVCPPFLISNVQAEMEKWINTPKRSIFLLKDTMLEKIKPLKEASLNEDVLIVDEAHRYKNESAKRTQALFKMASLFDRVIFMSGTPMPNRSIELYTILQFAAPENIGYMSRFQYAKHYCDAHHNGFGWDYSGVSNLKELRDRVQIPWEHYEEKHQEKKLMLRIRKSVLDLPPKLDEVVFIADNLPPKIGVLDRELVGRCAGQDLMKYAIAQDLNTDNLHTATYRRELGRAKVDTALPFIFSILEETDENIILATWHREVAQRLMRELDEYEPILIDGSTRPQDRVGLAEEYQSSKQKRVIILNIIAGGIGLNLQKADRVVFVEFSWVPGDNSQLSDRAHRIGRKDTVLCQYLVFKNSLDRAVIEAMLYKRQNTETI